MSQFAKEQHIEEDEMIKSLLADIAIIVRTFEGTRAAMYSAVRGGSQGRQTSNNVTYIAPEDMPPPMAPRLRRQNAFQQQDQQQQEDLEPDQLGDIPNLPPLLPQLSRTNTTPRQKALMRELSQGTSSYIPDLEEDQEAP